MLTTQYAGLLATVFAAAFIQGASGFGFGMAAMAVLPFLTDSKEAVVYVAVLAPFLCGFLLWNLRREADFRAVLPILAGSVTVGLPLGTLVYAVSDAWVLNQVIGVTLAASCACLWACRGTRVRRPPRWTAFPTGILSGVLGGTSNVGGAPLILYMWLQPVEKGVAAARLQLIFVVASAVRLGILAAAGAGGIVGFEAVSIPAALRALGALPMAAAGGAVGLVVLRRINPDLLRRWAYGFVFLMGLTLVVKARLEPGSGDAAGVDSAGSRPGAAQTHVQPHGRPDP